MASNTGFMVVRLFWLLLQALLFYSGEDISASITGLRGRGYCDLYYRFYSGEDILASITGFLVVRILQLLLQALQW